MPHLNNPVVTNPNLEITRKTADETVNNSAVMQDDDELIHALNANEIVYFRFILWITGNAGNDIEVGVVAPAGSTLRWGVCGKEGAGTTPGMLGYTTTGTTHPDARDGTETLAMGTGGANVQGCTVEGVCINGATAGNLKLQWAQDTAGANDTKVLANSCLLVYRLS